MRKFSCSLNSAVARMEKYKAVGSDNVHAEMLQVAPGLFASLLTQWWIVVGRTGIVPDSWNTSVLVPLFKKGEQYNTASYRPLCMLSHIRKILEKVVVEELDELTTTDRMQYGFQTRINTLQAEIEITARLESKEQLMAVILDLTKAYEKVSRSNLIRKVQNIGIAPDVHQIIIFLLPLRISTDGDVTNVCALLTIVLI